MTDFELTHDERVSLAEAFDQGLAAVYAWVVDTIPAHRDEAVVMADLTRTAVANTWESTRCGVLGPGLRRAADDIRADRDWFAQTVARKQAEANRLLPPTEPTGAGQ